MFARRSVSFLLTLAAFGCDEPVSPVALDVTTDTAVADACQPSTCPGAETSAPVSGDLRIGTNTAGQTAVESFVEAEDGTEMPVVLGGQGAWMVVLAAATDAFSCCVERVNITASLVAVDDGTEFGSLQFRRRPAFEGPDHSRYLLNVFLVLGDPEDWQDQEALLTVELEPYGGGEVVKDAVRVVLRRGGTTNEGAG